MNLFVIWSGKRVSPKTKKNRLSIKETIIKKKAIYNMYLNRTGSIKVANRINEKNLNDRQNKGGLAGVRLVSSVLLFQLFFN